MECFHNFFSSGQSGSHSGAKRLAYILSGTPLPLAALAIVCECDTRAPRLRLSDALQIVLFLNTRAASERHLIIGWRRKAAWTIYRRTVAAAVIELDLRDIFAFRGILSDALLIIFCLDTHAAAERPLIVGWRRNAAWTIYRRAVGTAVIKLGLRDTFASRGILSDALLIILCLYTHAASERPLIVGLWRSAAWTIYRRAVAAAVIELSLWNTLASRGILSDTLLIILCLYTHAAAERPGLRRNAAWAIYRGAVGTAVIKLGLRDTFASRGILSDALLIILCLYTHAASERPLIVGLWRSAAWTIYRGAVGAAVIELSLRDTFACRGILSHALLIILCLYTHAAAKRPLIVGWRRNTARTIYRRAVAAAVIELSLRDTFASWGVSFDAITVGVCLEACSDAIGAEACRTGAKNQERKSKKAYPHDIQSGQKDWIYAVF